MPLDPQNLDSAFSLLSELIAARSPSDPYSLVVCGGSALLAQKIISRSTHDVDVLAIREDGGMALAYPLPLALKQAAAEVATELQLEANWLNGMASLHFPDLFPDLALLPQSFWQQMEARDYGPCLRTSFVSRTGQILLKTYAALNRAEPRDLDDLRSLAPDGSEAESAVRWVLRAVPGVASRDQLHSLLTYLGHDHLVQTFQR